MPRNQTPDTEQPDDFSFGPGDRAVLEGPATALYQAAVEEDGVADNDQRVKDEPEAVQLLMRLGLFVHDSVTGTYAPRDPVGSQAQVITPLGQQGAELIAESSRWAQAYGRLGHAWRRSPASVHPPFTEIRGLENINRFLESVVEDAKSELLTAQPQANRTVKQLLDAASRDTRALERGVAMRTLYQHGARRSSATHRYVEMVTARGAEVRTLDEFFNRLIVVDRALAVIPAAEGVTTAVAIRERSTVAYLVDMFERSWDRGRPFGARDGSTMSGIAEEQRAMTIRMLIEGHADPTSAKRLGVSMRTYAGYVAALKEEYEAQTRFQLGYLMGQDGITGQDTTRKPRRRR